MTTKIRNNETEKQIKKEITNIERELREIKKEISRVCQSENTDISVLDNLFQMKSNLLLEKKREINNKYKLKFSDDLIFHETRKNIKQLF